MHTPEVLYIFFLRPQSNNIYFHLRNIPCTHHFLATLFTKILLTEQEPSSFVVLCWNYPGSQRRWSLTTSVIPKTFRPMGWTVRWASWLGTVLWFLNTIQMERLQLDFSELSHQCHTWHDQNPTCLWVAWSQEVETGRYTPKPHMRGGHACKLCSMGVEDQKKTLFLFYCPALQQEWNLLFKMSVASQLAAA